MNISPVSNQSTYDIKPLPKHISFATEEKVFENGMTLYEMSFKKNVWNILEDENVVNLKYGYQAHLNQDALKDMNFLRVNSEDTDLPVADFLSSDMTSLNISTLESGISLSLDAKATGITSNALMPVHIPNFI